MSGDYLPDSPYLARHCCPTCEPDADPTRAILELRYCPAHELRTDGADDGQVNRERYLSSTGEAVGSDGNAAYCELIHRKRALLRGPA